MVVIAIVHGIVCADQDGLAHVAEVVCTAPHYCHCMLWRLVSVNIFALEGLGVETCVYITTGHKPSIDRFRSPFLFKFEPGKVYALFQFENIISLE